MNGIYKSGCKAEVEGVGLLVSNMLNGHGTTIKLHEIKSFGNFGFAFVPRIGLKALS